MEHLAVVRDVIRDIVTRVELLESADVEARKRGLSPRTAIQLTRKRRRIALAERELGRLQFEKPIAYQQLSDGCLTCEPCDVSFSSPTQQTTHDALFHRDSSTDDDTLIDYHCCSCNKSFDALASLLLHSGCVDGRKLRLAAGDMGVCLLCGWAVKRAHLFDHLKAEHPNASNELHSTFPIECRFCSPTSLLKSAHDLLFHTAIWHSVNVAVQLRRIEPPQLCQLCNQYIPADQFRLHVVSVHISAAKERQLQPSIEQRKQAKAKKSFVQRKKTFDSIECLVNAVIAEHRTSQPSKSAMGLRCAGCQKMFESGPSLAKHKVMQECQPSFRTICPFCSHGHHSLVNREMWTHVTVDHDYRMLQAIGTNRDDWPSQVCGIGKEYRGRGPIACTFCPLQFQHDDTRQLHIALLHPRKKSPLINTGRPRSADSSSPLPAGNNRFVFPTALASPMQFSPNFRCLLCGAKFHTDFTLSLHRKTFHDTVSEQNSVLQRVLLAANDTNGIKFRLEDNMLGISRTATTVYWKTFVNDKRRELQATLLRSRQEPRVSPSIENLTMCTN